MGLNSGDLSVKASVNLWESLVRSIVEYASQIWGDEVWEEGEKLQAEMGRRILRCSPYATKAGIRGDLGFWTLRGRRDLNKLLYLHHILSLPEERLVKQAYYMSKQAKLKTNWAGRMQKILAKYDLQAIWDDERVIWNLDGQGNAEAKTAEDHKRFIKRFFYKKVLDYEEKVWWAEVGKKGARSKLRTYRTFKDPHLRLEKYLLVPGPCFGRTLMSDLRIGTNRLEIEMGRREGRRKKRDSVDNATTEKWKMNSTL